MSDEVPDERTQFTIDIKCPKCGNSGSAIWEKAAHPDPHGKQPTPLSLPVGFSQRAGANLIEVFEIVCDKCGTVQPD